MGLRAVTLGHGYAPVVDAVSAAIRNGTNFVRPSALELEAAEAFLDLVQIPEMVKFTKDGSTANTAAVKLARAVTGRDLVALCTNHPFYSYDDWAMVAMPTSAGIPAVTHDYTLRFRYNDIDSLAELFEREPGRIACVILEAERTEPPRDNFLQRLVDLVHREGALVILDENVTGFRWGNQGAEGAYGIEPDLSSWGKGIANGFALSALAGRRELMERGGSRQPLERVNLLSTTHGAEGAGLAAGIATATTYRDEPVIETLMRQGERLRTGVQDVIDARGVGHAFRVFGKASSLYFGTSDAEGTPSQPFRTLFLQELIRRGVLAPSFVISYAHTDEDVDRTVEIVDEALAVYADALEGGIERFLEGRPVRPAFGPGAENRAESPLMEEPGEFDISLQGIAMAGAPEGIGETFFEDLPTATALESADGSADPALEFRRTLGMFATGVTVITVRVGEVVHGMTANAFMSVSLRPPLILISIDRRAKMNALLREGVRYGVSVLEERQIGLSDRFAGRIAETSEEPVFEIVHETPLVEGALAHLVARVVRSYWGGDHSLFVGQVEYVRYGEGIPLLFHGGRYERVGRESHVVAPGELQQSILAIGVERTYEAGERLMSIGEPGDSLGLILEGTVEVRRPGRVVTLGPESSSARSRCSRRADASPTSRPSRRSAASRCRASISWPLSRRTRAAAIALIGVLASRFRETALDPERRQLGEPGRAVARLVPEHGEERLVEGEVAALAVARVDEVDVALVEARLAGIMCETSAMRATDAFAFGGDPCHVRAWWNEPPPALTATGTTSGSTPPGAAARAGASQSSGAWNCERCGGVRGQRCEPRTYSRGPASAGRSSSEIQHVIISAGTR